MCVYIPFSSEPANVKQPAHSAAERVFGPRLGHQWSGPRWALPVMAHMGMWPSLGAACGGPHGDVALAGRCLWWLTRGRGLEEMERQRGVGRVVRVEAFATWAAGAMFSAKSGLRLCLDALVIVSLRREPGVGPDGSGLGSEPGFLIPALP